MVDIKKRYWIILSSVILIAAILVSWLPFRLTIDVSRQDISLSIRTYQASAQTPILDAGIVYPPSISSDYEKLAAVYVLIEQMRLEHNRVGAIAAKDRENYKDRWDAYTDIFRRKLRPLLNEQNRLRDNIRRQVFTDTEWTEITSGDSHDVMTSIWGDKYILKELPTEATCDVINQLKVIDFHALDGSFVDPYEDFTTYTESDPQSAITVTSTNVSWVNLDRDGSSRVYKDYGSGHFGDLEHLITVCADGTVYHGDALGHWGLYNVDDADMTDYPALRVNLNYYTGSNYRIYLVEVDDGGSGQFDYTTTISWGDEKYLTIDRDGSDFDCYIYNNAARDDLFDTLTLSSCTETTMRYCYVLVPQGASRNTDFDGWSAHLDLQEAAEPDIYNLPTSKAFGVIEASSTHWSNGSEPSWPLMAGDCYFAVTNNGTVTIDISANGTNWIGGVGWNLTADSPGENTVRMSVFKVGDNSTDNLTLGTSPLSWISSLAASDNVSWEIKLETGTFTDGVGKTAHIYLTASAS